MFHFDPLKGIIEPQHTLTLPIHIKANELGPLEDAVQVAIVGQSEPVAICPIRADGEGPVVTAESTELNWGVIPVLQTFCKTVSQLNT